MIKWKHEGIMCKVCGKQAIVKGYCRKCYDQTPERKENHRKQSKEGYRRVNNKFRKKVELYNRLRAVRNTIDKVRDCIQIKKVGKIGHSCYITLPRNWYGREVVVFDNKFFMLHIVQRKCNEKEI